MKYGVNDDHTSSNKEFAKILEQKQIKWTTATTFVKHFCLLNAKK